MTGRAPKRTAVFAALKVAMDIAPVVIEQFYRPSRVAAMIRVRRRTERVYDKTAHQVLQFISPNLSGGTGSASLGAARRPVLLIGNWATEKKRSNKFAFQRFIDRLAKKAIIVEVDEHCTTRLCAMCGTTVMYPSKQWSKDMHKGTVNCPNTACPLRHSFLNRDVAAASNIVNRFLADMFMGGNLGAGIFLLAMVHYFVLLYVDSQVFFILFHFYSFQVGSQRPTGGFMRTERQRTSAGSRLLLCFR
jgi:hypothetical protein